MRPLNVMFSWLVDAGYLAGNPLSLSRHRARRAKPRITRYLDPDLWQELKIFIDSMPRETDRQRAHYFRVRWLFTLLYLGGLRISEVAENTMGSFFCRRDRQGDERWCLEVLGKGDKERLVPATTELMVELARYRREIGLAPYPSPNEETPLLLPIGKSREALTRAALHSIVKKVFEGAAERLRQRGDGYVVRADLLERASAHWLRHTAGSLFMSTMTVDTKRLKKNIASVGNRYGGVSALTAFGPLVGGGRALGLHSSRQAPAEYVRRELQRQVPGYMPERALVPLDPPCQGSH